MTEQYEVLIDDLRMELQAEQRLLEKLEADLEEREEQISTLRSDYIEAREANERLELNVEELKHELAKRKQEIRVLNKKKRSEIERDVLEENEHLRENLRISRKRYDTIVMEKNEMKEAVPEMKEPIPAVLSPISPQPDQMQQLLEQMVQQYESEIHILRTANEETMAGLQIQLENAIVDKEEIAEYYILEIERLDLALTEAVNLLTDLRRKYTNLKATAAPSQKGVRYRSLNEVSIKQGAEEHILPAGTEIICSRVIRRHSAQISKPENYKGLVDLQTISGKWLFEAVELADKDGSLQQNIEIAGIDDCKV